MVFGCGGDRSNSEQYSGGLVMLGYDIAKNESWIGARFYRIEPAGSPYNIRDDSCLVSNGADPFLVEDATPSLEVGQVTVGTSSGNWVLQRNTAGMYPRQIIPGNAWAAGASADVSVEGGNSDPPATATTVYSPGELLVYLPDTSAAHGRDVPLEISWNPDNVGYVELSLGLRAKTASTGVLARTTFCRWPANAGNGTVSTAMLSEMQNGDHFISVRYVTDNSQRFLTIGRWDIYVQIQNSMGDFEVTLAPPG